MKYVKKFLFFASNPCVLRENIFLIFTLMFISWIIIDFYEQVNRKLKITLFIFEKDDMVFDY